MSYNAKTRMLHIHNYNFSSTLYKVREQEIIRPSKLAILGGISILNKIALPMLFSVKNVYENAINDR